MAYIYYNPNPVGRSVDDCAVRAIAKALSVSWDDAHEMLCYNARMMGDMPHAESVWGSVLRQHGFYRTTLPNSCPDCYTAADFCRDNPYGFFVLKFSGHVATVVDGTIYDSWDSSREIPSYFWFRKGN